MGSRPASREPCPRDSSDWSLDVTRVSVPGRGQAAVGRETRKTAANNSEVFSHVNRGVRGALLVSEPPPSLLHVLRHLTGVWPARRGLRGAPAPRVRYDVTRRRISTACRGRTTCALFAPVSTAARRAAGPPRRRSCSRAREPPGAEAIDTRGHRGTSSRRRTPSSTSTKRSSSRVSRVVSPQLG